MPQPRRLRSLVLAVLTAGLLLGPAAAETLALPEALTGLASPQGEKLFAESTAREAFFPLTSNFLTQKTQAYCGVASLVMVLNALDVAAPPVPEYEPYRTFTQDNVLDEASDAVLPRPVLARMGMTLDQLGGLLTLRGAAPTVIHAGDSSVEDFRRMAGAALGTQGQFVVVNYLRKAMGQERGGHISPLAAYDAAADRFLILDVARYKYPPVWVSTTELFAAMNTPDSDNGGRTRGFVLVARKAP